MKRQLIADLGDFLAYADELEQMRDEVWFQPLGEGKWRIHDMIAHIMRWDVYFNNDTFPALTRSDFPELREHPDYLGYNEQSIIYAKGKTKQEIIEETKRSRALLISNLNKLDEHKFSVVYPGDRGFTLESYLTDFFTSHDKYHRKQIEDFLALHSS